MHLLEHLTTKTRNPRPRYLDIEPRTQKATNLIVESSKRLRVYLGQWVQEGLANIPVLVRGCGSRPMAAGRLLLITDGSRSRDYLVYIVSLCIPGIQSLLFKP